MNFRFRAKYSVALICFASAFAQQAVNPRVQTELDQGIAQYKTGKYKTATLHLRKALKLDSESWPARLYLAKALTEQYEPSLKTARNPIFATDAEKEFRELLKHQPPNVEVLKGFAKLKEQTGDTEEARRYYAEAIAADGKDAEAYTALGGLDYRRAILKINTSESSNSNASATKAPPCEALRAENLPALDAVIAELKKAADLHQQNGTAAYYLSLAYSARTRLECSDSKARDADRNESAAWLERSMKWPVYPEQAVVYTSASM